MDKKYLIIPDQHAHPDHNNDRADWMGELIKDEKPDVVVNIGDAADMASLSQYDKGKAKFQARNYERDIVSHLDFQSRMWEPVRRAKKKQPYRVMLEGNHEFRVKRAMDTSPELAGDRFGISFNDFDFKSYYNEVIEYEADTPGVWQSDGVNFAHYFISGVLGKPIGGLHHAYTMLNKNALSSVCGHSHMADMAIQTRVDGTKMSAVVVGVYQDYRADWAGKCNDLWWSGAVMLHNVNNGMFDAEFISMERIKREYG